ncbi:hypothetical protein COLO4_09505 [Corchorus olitorius]|uniref:Uncharacterized protein n=1 Tax=Corchorus olitorius TaxID=93759 RepID=A0A1R3KBZ4_9ROSI|nr:hypothetical protein COLO4_09505 [Corchorus olitorius]
MGKLLYQLVEALNWDFSVLEVQATDMSEYGTRKYLPAPLFGWPTGKIRFPINQEF